jgi:hypothetical protein
VLVHVDTEQAHEKLINTRLAYVSVSRGRYDVQIYTNDADSLNEKLSWEVSKRAALETDHKVTEPDQDHVLAHAQPRSGNASPEQGQPYGMGR